MVIRQAMPHENREVHRLVQTIADETFSYLFPSGVPVGEPEWLTAWLAIARDEIVGVTRTRDEWVTDLWVRRDCRRTGIGSKLLEHSEWEMQTRGYRRFRLRVVKSNTRAIEFYRSQGWTIEREFPHEKFGHAMLELAKSVEPPRAGFEIPMTTE